MGIGLAGKGLAHLVMTIRHSISTGPHKKPRAVLQKESNYWCRGLRASCSLLGLASGFRQLPNLLQRLCPHLGSASLQTLIDPAACTAADHLKTCLFLWAPLKNGSILGEQQMSQSRPLKSYGICCFQSSNVPALWWWGG